MRGIKYVLMQLFKKNEMPSVRGNDSNKKTKILESVQTAE